MKKSIDFAFDDHPDGDEDKARVAWAVAVLDDCDGCADIRVELSVEEAGVFKPDPKVYRLVEARCGVKPGKVCFLSSNCWDAHGAAHFGFKTVWVNRGSAPNDNLPGALVDQVADLSGLPALLGVA